ncbi:MAG: hypothetical protein RLZZ618_4181 [Pseudomonadota bacterium]|jgi:hypothetical protein
MGLDELNGKYARLLGELDAAYTAPVWNVRMIDRLADEIVQTELALSSNGQHPSEE